MFSRNSRTDTTQKKHTHSRIAPNHVMREQDSLATPRLWAEEGVGRANLHKHENPIGLCLRYRSDFRDPGPKLS